MSYRKEIDEYIENESDEFDIINDIYLSYPTLKISVEDLILIRKTLHKELEIDYGSIRIIGSSHTGFSLFKNTEFSDESDIDIAIINERLFNKLHEELINDTKGLKDRSLFKSYKAMEMFQFNFLRGYIRDVLLINNEFKVKVQRICEDLTAELNKSVNVAFYLNESTFRYKVLESIKKYKEIKK